MFTVVMPLKYYLTPLNICNIFKPTITQHHILKLHVTKILINNFLLTYFFYIKYTSTK